jgi:hypothetical protein
MCKNAPNKLANLESYRHSYFFLVDKLHVDTWNNLKAQICH